MKRSILTVALLCSAVSVSATETDAYIESSGVTGIDTGYKLKSTSRIELDFALSDASGISGGSRVFGSDKSHTALGLTGSLYVDNQKCWRIHVGNGTEYKDHYLKFKYPGDSSETLHECDTERHRLVIDYPARTFSMNVGSLVLTNAFWTNPSVYPVEGSECSQTLALYSRQLLNGGFENASKVRIYGLKIYENDVLVRDYSPCLKDGIPGFTEKIGGGFFSNMVTDDAFSAVGNVDNEESTYVATPDADWVNAGLYLDTLYYATADTRCEMDYSLRATPVEKNAWLFSGFGDDNTYGVYIKKNGTTFGMHNGTGWSNDPTIPPAGKLNIRRTIVLDYPNNKLHLITGGVTNNTANAKANADCNYNTYSIKIAGRFNAGSGEFAPVKIYGFRIYEKNVLVRDFKPCISGPDQTGKICVGMKDVLTGLVITYPEATESKRLTCGGTEPVASDPYVQLLSADKEVVDTGYFVLPETKVELDCSLAEARPAGKTYYLFWAKDTALFAGFINDKGFGFINTPSGWEQNVATSFYPDIAGVRRIVTLDNPASLASVSSGKCLNEDRAMKGPGDSAYARLSLKLGGGVNIPNEHASIRIYNCRIWEKVNGEYVLKHHFIPAVKDGRAYLYDVVEGSFKTSNSLTYGGAFVPDVVSSATKLCAGDAAELTASAPGAASYRWFLNGVPVDGGEDGTLTVYWRKGASSDVYTVRSVYSVDGLEVFSELSSSVTVENLPVGMVISVR